MEKIKKARAVNNFMTGVFYIVAGMFLLLLLVFASYVIIKGFSGATPEMFTFTRQGVMNQLFNTIYLVLLSLIFSVPLGIGAGIYLAEYAKKGKVSDTIKICIETLSSLPSIVIGLFGYLVFIVMTGFRWNLLAGSLAVSILCLPLITTTTCDALRNLPDTFRQGSFGLGATKWQTIFHILLPSCLPRIFTGIILAAGRGFGEAAALMYTAGMSTDINWGNWDITSPTCPLNPMRPGETLSLYIWSSFTESTAANAHEIANLSAAILMILVLVFNLIVRGISHRIDKKAIGGK